MKVNQLKAGVMLTYISEAISIMSGLIYTPIMLKLLGQSEYGLYQLSASVISYLRLLSMGFGASYIRYYARYKVTNDRESIKKLNGMYMTIYIVIGLMCLAAGSVLVMNVENIFKKSLTADEINTSRILMSFMVLNLAISFPGSVFGSHITANEQYIFQRVVNILRSLLNPCLTLPLLLMGYKSVAMVVVQTVLSVVGLITNWIFAKKKLGMSFSFKNFEMKFLRELFIFSFWIFLNQIIDQVNNQVDKFILGIYSGTISVAIYGVANQIFSMYISFSTAISSVFTPRVNKLVMQGNSDEELTGMFVKVGRLQFMLLFLAVSGLVIFGQYFISIWAGEGYSDAYIIALLLIIPSVIPWIQNLGIEIQRAKNKHQLRSIIYFIMAVINVLVSIPMAKHYGAIGTAIGTTISIILCNGIAMNIIYQKVIGINVIKFWKSILSFIPGLIAPILAGVLIMNMIEINNILMFVLLVLAYILIYCVSIWFLGMNKDEKQLFLGMYNKILKRNR
ncbi:MAG: lipopolysaccharide biosynthesis protein [Monoglobales bacterium]